MFTYIFSYLVAAAGFMLQNHSGLIALVLFVLFIELVIIVLLDAPRRDNND